MQQPSPERAPQPSFVEKFPGPEDWEALQGGMPRVFRQAERPNSPWIVLHVYDQHPDHERRFQSGLIVDTLPERTRDLLPYTVIRRNEDDEPVERTIVIPSFMNRAIHGDMCEGRSRSVQGDGYPRIKNQQQYEDFISRMLSQGYQELRFAVSSEGFNMRPLSVIRNPRPLAE